MASKIVKIKVTADIFRDRYDPKAPPYIGTIGLGVVGERFNRNADGLMYWGEIIGDYLNGELLKFNAVVKKHFPGFETDGCDVDQGESAFRLYKRVNGREQRPSVPEWNSKKKAFIADLAKLVGSFKIPGIKSKRVTS